MQALAAQPALASAQCSSSSSRSRAGQRLRPAAALGGRAAAAGSSLQSGSLRRQQQQQQQQQRQQRGRLLVTAAVKVSKGKQILCNKTMKAKDGSGEAVTKLCADVAEFSRGRMSDRSSGVLAFEVSEDDYEKGTFHFLELYSSQKAMADHNSFPEIKRFVEQIEEHLDGPLGMVLYEYNNGSIGPACMEGEVKGEGGLDDATGTNRFGGGASMKQTSNVVDLTQIKEKDDEEKGIWGLNLNIKLPDWFAGRNKADQK